MVNKQKSRCQLRLEARSRACCAPTSASSDPHLLAAELQSRIARANEIRAMRTRQLAARARARVQHAQEVARGMRVKRHEAIRVSRQSSIFKVEEAARRRHKQLTQLQLQCKKRTELITEKVELVRANQSDRADRARRTLADQLDEASSPSSRTNATTCSASDKTLAKCGKCERTGNKGEVYPAMVPPPCGES
ncbi:unnamed protein product [Peronospora destructor]|uniref:Uncharacterized protein n=1 Tax=Peronospora destructor TaxID=86335 RepID=A0AAV0TBH0_9STRA|nr:unnamed protein product [Peronospora destructor]